MTTYANLRSIRYPFDCKDSRCGPSRLASHSAVASASLAPSTSGRSAIVHSAAFKCLRSVSSSPSALQALGKRNQSSISSSLIAVLKDEIKYERESYRRSEDIADGPPNDFVLSDKPGTSWFFLIKKIGNEDVVVRVDIDAQPDVGEEEEDEEYEDDEDAEDLPIEFNVSIFKNDDPDETLFFDCESNGDYLTITRVQLKRSDQEDEDVPPYRGPTAFEDLDDTLQQAFVDYLEERGVNSYLGEFVRLYALDKATLEYQRWLNGVKDFIAR